MQHLLQHALPALSALQEQILSKGVCHRCYASLTPPPPADAIQEDDLPDFSPQASPPVSVVHKLGPSVINDPWYNKGTAFPMSERERLGLRGLLPPRIITMQLQVSVCNVGQKVVMHKFPMQLRSMALLCY